MIHDILNTAVGTAGRNAAPAKKAPDEPEKKSFTEVKAAYKTSFRKEILKSVTYGDTAKMGGASSKDSPTDFQTLVANLLARQGITYEEALAGKTVNVDEQARSEAQELVSEDGYWGVEKTSSRIFDFAVSAAGNDPDKLEQIKGAVQKGFDMALSSFGNSLPEISYNTLDSVMEKLDQWAEDLSEGKNRPEE